MRKEKTILNLLFLYFLYVFFYGIIIKITIRNGMLFSIKTYVPELIISIVCVESLSLNKLRFTKWQVGGLAYFFAVFVLGCLFSKSLSGALYVVRDFFLPVFAFILLCSTDFGKESRERFVHKFLVLGKVFLIVGCVLGIAETINGWSWTANFYTGYSFYGTDPLSKVRITEYLGRVRAPGLTGNFVTFSYYGLVSSIFILFGNQTKQWKKIFYTLMQLGILFATLNKTAIAAYIVVLVFYLFRKTKKAFRYTVTLFVAVIAFWYILVSDVSYVAFFSTYERLAIWRDLSRSVKWYEVIIPINCLNYNSMAEGAISFWDNTYYYLLFSQGIIGLVWIYYNSYRAYKKNTMAYPQMRYVFELMFVFLISASAFNNITNGRSFFPVFLLLNGVFFSTGQANQISCNEEGDTLSVQ